jgi:hypothetical protein
MGTWVLVGCFVGPGLLTLVCVFFLVLVDVFLVLQNTTT